MTHSFIYLLICIFVCIYIVCIAPQHHWYRLDAGAQQDLSLYIYATVVADRLIHIYKFVFNHSFVYVFAYVCMCVHLHRAVVPTPRHCAITINSIYIYRCALYVMTHACVHLLLMNCCAFINFSSRHSTTGTHSTPVRNNRYISSYIQMCYMYIMTHSFIYLLLMDFCAFHRFLVAPQHHWFPLDAGVQ